MNVKSFFVYSLALTLALSSCVSKKKYKALTAENDFNLSQVQIPVTVKYAISENISGLVGAKYGMFMDKDSKDALDKSANLSLEGGASYGFTEKIFGEVKYAYGITDFGAGNRLNGFLISVGYKL